MASYLTMKSTNFIGDISVMKQAMAVMQHHDAITGTSMQFVIDDYVRILHGGFEECLKIKNSFYQYTGIQSAIIILFYYSDTRFLLYFL